MNNKLNDIIINKCLELFPNASINDAKELSNCINNEFYIYDKPVYKNLSSIINDLNNNIPIADVAYKQGVSVNNLYDILKEKGISKVYVYKNKLI